MLDRKEVENYIKTLSPRERLSLVFSDTSVDWEECGLPQSMARSLGMIAPDDADAELIDKVHEVQMKLLDELLRVSVENGLKIYAIYGTLLGAVRDGGIIPGDDDIDVALMREDYDKLMSMLSVSETKGCFGGQGDLFGTGFFMQTPKNSQCFYGGYLKFRYCNSTALQPENWWSSDCHEGIGIDVFPIDTGFESSIREWFKNKKLVFWQRMLYAKAYGIYASFKDMPLLVFKGYKYFGKLFSRGFLADTLDRVMKSGDKLTFSKDQRFGIYAHYSKGKGARKLNAAHFAKSVELNYEGRTLWAPAKYKECLKLLYGNKYMFSDQPVFEKKRHGFYQVDVPYQNYKNRMAGLYQGGIAGKKVVIFGDETFLPFYKQKWPDYKPEIIINAGVRNVELEREFFSMLKRLEKKESMYPGEIYEESCNDDNFKLRHMNMDKPYEYAESGCSYEDVQYVEAETFFAENVNFDSYYFVICSLYIREAEERLRSFGVKNYHIYVPNQHREWLLLEDPKYVLLYTNVK